MSDREHVWIWCTNIVAYLDIYTCIITSMYIYLYKHNEYRVVVPLSISLLPHLSHAPPTYLTTITNI